MARPSAETLFAVAKSQARRLTVRERRLVIAYLDEHPDESYSNYKLADLSGVDERVIRDDRKAILREYSRALTPLHALAFVAQYMRSHDALIRKARAGLEKSIAGSLGHQNYLRLLSDLETKRMKMLQEIGAVPKELGHVQITEERWVATVSEDGVTSVGQHSGYLPETTTIN